jgi:hypothetical protein
VNEHPINTTRECSDAIGNGISPSRTSGDASGDITDDHDLGDPSGNERVNGPLPQFDVAK